MKYLWIVGGIVLVWTIGDCIRMVFETRRQRREYEAAKTR